MNLKRVFKWIGCIVAAMILIYITILVVIIFLFAGGSDYQKGSIYLSELQNSGLYYSDEEHKIADFDKDTFEALAINAIKNRKALQLGPIENQTLRQYLSK